ncbi:hypothetical protein E2493_18945 [Sphingomonas parva]|uniref:Uncharacterized protein n=1 Tax=Sphingomonas parva TaxID=2555898 RepID=A0A4Y8ZML4_9SPHN|nr:DUF6445 family protein [Sphingomonas parva]TFI56697.1 hypothetical protein E2493_18945 [Sphingomonas parva]
MPLNDDLFALAPHPVIRCEWLGGRVPVILVDGVYADPDAVRAAALSLEFSPAATHYPGRLASIPDPNPSRDRMLRWARGLADTALLGVFPLMADGRPVVGFREVFSDFAIVDVHPDALTPEQRIPHVDPVPAFGLVYLNREERGGTLFFERLGDDRGGPGYFTTAGSGYALLGRIEPRFNRLAIYPGCVPHSGEIAGEWIRSDERFRRPRLTQRLLFAA